MSLRRGTRPQAAGPQGRVRLRPFSPRSGAGDRRSARRPQRPDGDADRIGQVAVLPSPRSRARRRYHRGVAALGLDARSSAGAPARRRRGGRDQLVSGPRCKCGRMAARRRGRDASPLSRARTAHDGAHARRPRQARRAPHRDRRSALHLTMGTVVPAGVPGPLPPRHDFSRRADRGADRYRRPADARRHRGANLRRACRHVRARL